MNPSLPASLAVAAAAALATPVSAQTAMSCDTVWSSAPCVPSAPPPVDPSLFQTPGSIKSYVNGYVFGQRIGAEREAIQQQQDAAREQIRLGAERLAQRDRDEHLMEAQKMIAAGKCPEAKRMALLNGDLALLKRIDGLCPNSAPAGR